MVRLAVVGTIRQLPYTAVPVPGEAFSSWLDRTAVELDLKRRDVWLRVGLIDDVQQVPIAYGVDLPEFRRELLVASTGLSWGLIGGTMLSCYDPAVVAWANLDLTSSAALQRWRPAADFYIWPSLACATCVAESGGVWKLDWKLPWSFVCPKHRCYLFSNCPSCGGRLQAKALDRRQQFICCARVQASMASSIPRLGRTSPRQGSKEAVRRRATDICTAPVAEFVASRAGEEAVELQGQILALLRASADDVHEHVLLNELRLLTRFVLHLGVPALLADCDEIVQERFSRHAADRDARTRSSTQNRGAIADPLLFGAAIQVAGRLVFAKDLDEAWEKVMANVLRDGSNARTQWSNLNVAWSPPARHAPSLYRARERYLSHVPRIDGVRTRSSRRRFASATVDARHIPALMWPNAYAFLADGLLKSKRVVCYRRFAALALLRHLDPDFKSWPKAVTWLNLHRGYGVNAYHVIRTIARDGLGLELDRRLSAIEDAMAASPILIDYRERREVLANLTSVDLKGWTRICKTSGVDPTHPRWLRRRPQAAAWLWSTITGGDWHSAPALRLAELPRRQRQASTVAYQYFEAHHLLEIRASLTAFAEVSLERWGLSGPLTMELEIVDAG